MASDDYARATDSARTVEIDGRPWQVGKLTPRDMGDLQAFLKEVVPDPVERSRQACAGMSDDVAKLVWTHFFDAIDAWPPSFLSAEGNQHILYTHEGNARLLLAVLRRHNRGIDLGRCRELAEGISIDTLDRIVDLALPEYARRPKAATAGPEDPV